MGLVNMCVYIYEVWILGYSVREVDWRHPPRSRENAQEREGPHTPRGISSQTKSQAEKMVSRGSEPQPCKPPVSPLTGLHFH